MAVTASRPQTRARERKGGGRDDRDVDIERPIIRLVGSDQERRHEGTHDAQARERRAMQQSGRERQERDDAEQNEGRAGR